MANPNRTARPARVQASPAPVALWTSLFVQPFVDVQRMQWHAYLGWQQSLATFQKDAWEQWAVRYGGGVPIDG